MADRDTSATIRAWAEQRRLPAGHLARWLEMNERDRAALLTIARALRLSTGAMVTALTTLEEICVRESCSIESVLARGEITRAVRGQSASGPARAKTFLAAIKSMRYPRLAEATRRLDAELAALDLPRGISIVLPKDLASAELRIELQAGDGAMLKRLIEALSTRTDQLAQITDRLSGGQ